MYHSISSDPEFDRSAYYKVCTTPERLSRQMNWLAENGYQGVTLGKGLDSLQSPDFDKGLKPVAITFDDGFWDFYTEAFPILHRHGFHATMYLPTAFIGRERRRFQSRDCMTWAEIAELQAGGIEFGSHTATHPKLVECSWPQIEEELRSSKEAIEQHLGCPAKSFAYPYAFPQARKDFTSRFHQVLKKIAYQSCVTTEVGRVAACDKRFSLKRLPVNDADDPLLLRAKLEGAYDWLGFPQASVKAARQALKNCFSRSRACHAQAKTSPGSP